MNDLLVVGEADDLRDLPHQVEACSYVERVSLLSQKVVEPDRLRVVLEDEGGPQLVLGEAVDAQDARMLERFQELKFSQGRSFELAAVLLGGLGRTW